LKLDSLQPDLLKQFQVTLFDIFSGEQEMQIFSNSLKLAAAALAISFLSGCAINMQVPVKDPTPSTVKYDKSGALTPVALQFKDEQTADDKAKLLTGRIPMQLMSQDKPFEALPWIAQHTVKELAARGLPVSLATNEANSTSVIIKRVHIENHRATGFSPFVTFTSLRADVMTPQGPQRVTAYIKRGKTPVWSFDEIINPTYNEPLALLTKELAAKINQQLFGQMITDAQVNELAATINKDAATRDDTYMDVYQLGFGNNPSAIPELVKLTANPSEYVRLAAISSLGILKANDQFDFLAARYELKDGSWQDRAMSLKAIGDLGTARSRAYLQKEWEQLKNKTDNDSLWTKEIISLYL
jgi:hypothetical protein